ncbi:MAG: hypothetical protein K6G62_07665 [Eubacterium sp.]|nr:hypothetical protein [Eubacterium sp.]
MDENIVFNTEDVKTNKPFGILAYLGILFLVPMLGAKESQYARFHANQGFVLFIAEIIAGIAVGILSAILGLIPVLGGLMAGILTTALSVGSLCLMVIGIINACSGEPKKLPVIGGIVILS